MLFGQAIYASTATKFGAVQSVGDLPGRAGFVKYHAKHERLPNNIERNGDPPRLQFYMKKSQGTQPTCQQTKSACTSQERHPEIRIAECPCNSLAA